MPKGGDCPDCGSVAQEISISGISCIEVRPWPAKCHFPRTAGFLSKSALYLHCSWICISQVFDYPLCPPITGPMDAEAMSGCSGSPIGSTCDVVCQEGYEASGNAQVLLVASFTFICCRLFTSLSPQVTCSTQNTPTGTQIAWTGSVCLPLQCNPDPSAALDWQADPASVESCSTTIQSGGTQCFIPCPSGTLPAAEPEQSQGGFLFDCVLGNWTGNSTDPDCLAVCADPPVVSGAADLGHCANTPSGSFCVLTCLQGHAPLNPHITCENGQWSDNSCTSVAACVEPPDISNSADLSDCAFVAAEGFCDVVCDTCFGPDPQIIPSLQVSCDGSTNTWRGDLDSICVPTTCPSELPFQIDHADMASSHGTLSCSTWTPVCNVGFTLIPGSDDRSFVACIDGIPLLPLWSASSGCSSLQHVLQLLYSCLQLIYSACLCRC